MEKSDLPGEAIDLEQAYRVSYLVAGYIRHTLTEREHDELDDWVNASDRNMQLFEDLTDDRNLDSSLQWYEKLNTERALNKTKPRLEFNKRSFTMRPWQSVVAISVLVVFGIIIYSYFFRTTTVENDPISQTENDIAPGSGRAILVLSGGKKITVNNTRQDTSIGNGIDISGQQAAITYKNVSDAPPSLHTLIIPSKGFFKLQLSDGSKVWLNSQSSIAYPTSFTGSERKVRITGEAYFEVAKDSARPFRVQVNEIQIEVLGTTFNVNAYDNESSINTTLLEGAVKITSGSTMKFLNPGEQAQVTPTSLNIIQTPTTDIIAWKDHAFKFTNVPLQTILREAARWYDAEIVYKDSLTAHFNATIGRDVPVSMLLHLLEQTKQVHFEIKGRQIIVMR